MDQELAMHVCRADAAYTLTRWQHFCSEILGNANHQNDVKLYYQHSNVIT